MPRLKIKKESGRVRREITKQNKEEYDRQKEKFLKDQEEKNKQVENNRKEYNEGNIQHKYVSTRNEIDEIKLPDKKFEKFYNDIIFMCCLRIKRNFCTKYFILNTCYSIYEN